MSTDNLVSGLSVLAGNGSFVSVKVGAPFPGGAQDDPVCIMFYDPETREMELEDEDDSQVPDPSFVTVVPGRYLIFTDKAVQAVLEKAKCKVSIHEIRGELVWCSTKEVDASEADEQITALLGMSLSDAVAQRQKQVEEARSQQSQQQAQA